MIDVFRPWRLATPIESLSLVERLAGRPWSKADRTLGKVLVIGLAVFLYLLGWLIDIQRIANLRALPATPIKTISKYEAWNRIYQPEGAPNRTRLSAVKRRTPGTLTY